MSKKAKQSRTADNEAIAIGRYIKGSERKLNLLAQLIRGKSAARALTDLRFSHRRMAIEARKVLESAIANAENNHSLDVDKLFVKSATVGRTMKLSRFHARGRGRAAGIEKPFANLTIIVGERAVTEEKKKKKPAAKKAPKAKKETAAKAE